MLKMRTVGLTLFVIFISSLDGFSAVEPSIYVRVTWDMSWRRFCYFIPLFREKISEELYEMESVIPYRVNETRVRLMNDKTNCRGDGSSEDAELDFFVSKREEDLGPADVDRNITIHAYRVLYDYWRNKKMALLDPIFLGKVNKVELMGRDKPDISEGMTEATRVAIGIVVGLAIAFTIAIISLALNARRQINKRPAHGIPLNVLPSEPRITMVDDPAAYDHYKQDEPPKYNEQDDPRQYYRQDDQQDGYARQDSGSFNGYAGQHMKYDDEPLGSPML
ncbi:uncharacterized protein LOC144653724 isoform X1 [Oculina patagonica]